MSSIDSAGGARAGERGRARWIRVRVETEESAYVGRLRIEGRASLRELVGGARAYLGLWSATEEVSGRRDDFVALHKGTIRSVVALGDDDDGLAAVGGA